MWEVWETQGSRAKTVNAEILSGSAGSHGWNAWKQPDKAGPRSEPVGRSGQNSSNRQSIQQTPKFKHFFSGSWRSWGLQFLLVQDRKVLFFHQNMPEHQENHCVLNKSKVQFSTFPTGFPFNLGNKIVFWFLFLLYTLPVGRILAWSPDWFRLRAHRFRLFSWI